MPRGGKAGAIRKRFSANAPPARRGKLHFEPFASLQKAILLRCHSSSQKVLRYFSGTLFSVFRILSVHSVKGVCLARRAPARRLFQDCDIFLWTCLRIGLKFLSPISLNLHIECYNLNIEQITFSGLPKF